jgi:hypothetical protein
VPHWSITKVKFIRHEGVYGISHTDMQNMRLIFFRLEEEDGR